MTMMGTIEVYDEAAGGALISRVETPDPTPDPTPDLAAEIENLSTRLDVMGVVAVAMGGKVGIPPEEVQAMVEQAQAIVAVGGPTP
jgi:hypothetical protein